MSISPNTCESTLNVPIQQELQGCVGADFQGYIVSITDANSGTVYRRDTNVVVPYTSNSAGVLNVGQDVCVTGSNIDSAGSWILGIDYSELTYYKDGVPITNTINFSIRWTLQASQFFINANIIFPNTTINVDSYGASLLVTVTIDTQIALTQLKAILNPCPPS